ncbi:3-phosphoshikimate 1-carboxyvinyltransferase [Rhodoluna sp. KAS3]|uniref:3-phosphoshikimate 1-carboxyvinyltransferase n=1 Tax=Rhodoluna sp. KAS3 TaxID=942880 RepID=UPI00223019C7|nr:3-phosphoshikimate 1-carboxyvinyltransferase [Rhodoluna sp. KAS3]BDS49319.1 3-phosphoshikimate 1-carboxyvinyltransferase 1 [Rhodoluna sp. KAS3]
MTSNQNSQPWHAPVASAPLDAAVALPGSKSLNNRELVLSALASEPTLLTGTLASRDSTLMIEALRQLGTDIEVRDVGSILVTPKPFDNPAVIDCGLAGTVMRFVPPAALLSNQKVVFDGDEAARRRPMSTTIDSLRALGVSVSDEGKGSLPFTVHGTGTVAGGEVTIDASASSQFVSGLLLAAARFENGLVLRHVGEHLPSMPHIEMTLDCLTKRGVKVSTPEPAVWKVEPGLISGGSVAIEPDLSNAGPFLAAAMVAGGSVFIQGWPDSTTQVGDEFDGILQQMGAEIVRENGGLTITGTGAIHGIDIDLSIGGELTPVIAALAALADSPTVIRGVAHLRGHETDRLAALAAEINRIGGIARETPDGLEIDPSDNLHGAIWQTYEDHRMATAGAIIGLRVPGIQIEDITTTSKTMPNFASMWQGMLGQNNWQIQLGEDA